MTSNPDRRIAINEGLHLREHAKGFSHSISR
jgi:hypothetical protein